MAQMNVLKLKDSNRYKELKFAIDDLEAE